MAWPYLYLLPLASDTRILVAAKKLQQCLQRQVTLKYPLKHSFLCLFNRLRNDGSFQISCGLGDLLDIVVFQSLHPLDEIDILLWCSSSIPFTAPSDVKLYPLPVSPQTRLLRERHLVDCNGEVDWILRS